VSRGIVIGAATMLALVWSTQGRPQIQGQASPSTFSKYEYEVASIKPHKPDPTDAVMSGVSRPPDGLVITNWTVQALLRMACEVQDNQISGLPAWARSDGYDIDAKMDAITSDALKKLNEEDGFRARQQMLQALLAERFKLGVHRETRELPVYSLVIAKGGFKLQPVPPDKVYPNGTRGSASTSTFAMGGGKITGHAIPIAALTQSLTQILGRTVLDKTGLAGVYDVPLQWATSNSGQPLAGDGAGGASSADPSGATIFIAIQEQLGLKLEAGKGPVEIIVIDRVEKPSGN
jgi:uncharacterized protein (TIGR03435 family)